MSTMLKDVADPVQQSSILLLFVNEDEHQQALAGLEKKLFRLSRSAPVDRLLTDRLKWIIELFGKDLAPTDYSTEHLSGSTELSASAQVMRWYGSPTPQPDALVYEALWPRQITNQWILLLKQIYIWFVE